MMTVNAVRVRLGKLVEKMFTPDFQQIYEESVPKLKNNVDKYLIQFLSQSDAYIRVIAKNLDKPDVIEAINRFAYPLVVFCVGERYHLLTCELIQKTQTEDIEVPAEDEQFFTYMLIDYCEEPI